MAVAEAAALFRVSVSYIYKVRLRRRRTGETTARLQRCHLVRKLSVHHEVISAEVAARPDLTLAELRAWLSEEHGVTTSVGGLWNTLERLGLTLEKTRHAAEQERADVAAARDAWRQHQPTLNPARLVFIDETWATTNRARLCGRCRRSQRLRAAVPHGHWGPQGMRSIKTSTFVAALRSNGITAPFVIDGAINGRVFRTYVEEVLAPCLAEGDVVIMDNLGAHKVEGVRQAIEARSASVLYLPPYSPDLNPIEQVFAKLKQLLKTVAARTITDLWAKIGTLLDDFSPKECTNDITNCRYRQSP
ncbi:MAG: IS630 family transposase [Defluviicoccus sp.]|nr:MAG: IS630 family transposase [Defluviicoccus sp.]